MNAGDAIYNLDVILFRFVNQSLSCDMLDWLVYFASDRYFLYLIILLSAVYLYRKYGPRSLIVVVIAIIAVSASDFTGFRFIRPLFSRARPCLIPEANAIPLLGRNTSYSMPSLHAASAFGFATVVWFYYRKVGWALAGAALLIGFCRVYGGVHWPSDILAGALLGCSIACLAFGFTELTLYIIRRTTGKPVFLLGNNIRISKE
ncbi:MAG: phosphatase PAP2 family protein [bacterium]|nr:phosphatase PAP2 family protein [bacterium]